jgi:hypothetical protein
MISACWGSWKLLMAQRKQNQLLPPKKDIRVSSWKLLLTIFVNKNEASCHSLLPRNVKKCETTSLRCLSKIFPSHPSLRDGNKISFAREIVYFTASYKTPGEKKKYSCENFS